MAKLKKPLLSLEAKGTLGDSLTFQHRKGIDFVRQKPVPAQPRTLPQMYQRWLYEDYIYLWHQQSASTKRQWNSDASPHHMTGFAYWMQYYLKGLPDIAGYYKLDLCDELIAHDSSRNLNHGTVVGATPTIGLIDRCLSFDGLIDRVQIPHHTELNLPDRFTIDFFFSPGKLDTYQYIVYKHGVVNLAYDIRLTNLNRIEFRSFGLLPSVITSVKVFTPADLGKWFHFAITYDRSTLSLYIAGILDKAVPTTGVNWTSAAPLWLATTIFATWWYQGLLDHLLLNNRCLDSTEILRHSVRRYPL